MSEVYICKHCGNVIELLADGGGKLVCCGEPMVLQKENTTDAAKEKHIPVVTVDKNKLIVQVGSVAHPMIPEHFIGWIEVLEGDQLKRATLKPGNEPKAEFYTKGEQYTVRAYCNLHGLWAGNP
ncbi:MAG: desulfoferrodoxin [Planctomycetaceae bacterium]|jgi:superoxide reductase|nr:desulfoferrodoxin [Planctomycetaceae bacterium]